MNAAPAAMVEAPAAMVEAPHGMVESNAPEPAAIHAETTGTETADPVGVDVLHAPLLLRGQRAPFAEREWHTRGEERVVAEVPLDSEVSLEAAIAEEGTSRRWFWTTGFCALVLFFCAGLFFLQRAADTQLDVAAGQAAAAEPQPIASDLGATHGQESTSAGAAGRGMASRNGFEATGLDQSGAGAVGSSGSGSGLGSSESGSGSGSGSGGVRRRAWRGAGQARYLPTALFGVSPGIMSSHLVYAPAPEYPRMARLTHIEGQVVVEAVVARNGRVSRANVLSGHRLLRGAALHAIRERRYRPYVVNGKPSDVATILTVDFRLR
jgi:TonB family protein